MSMQQKYVGCLIGSVLGDALGAPSEFKDPHFAHQTTLDQLNNPDLFYGQYTDDGQKARVLAQSIVDSGGWDPQVFADGMADLWRSGKQAGTGPTSLKAIAKMIEGVPWHACGTPSPAAGNGAAMSVAPLAMYCHAQKMSEDEMIRVVMEYSSITHLDNRAGTGAVLIAWAIMQGLDGRKPWGLLDKVTGSWVNDLIYVARKCECPEFVESLDHLNTLSYSMNGPESSVLHKILCTDPEWPGISAYVVPSVTWALWAARKSGGDFEQAMLLCAEGGGDVDTTMAMCGGIMGATLGRSSLLTDLVDKLHDREGYRTPVLVDLATKICK